MNSNWLYRNSTEVSTEAIIFDVDGVLADASNRQHFLKGVDPDWTGFFDACHQDPLIPESAKLLDLIDPKYTIILMTGRPTAVQQKTLDWLEHFSLRWDMLIMRHHGDYSAAKKFKQNEIIELKDQGFTIVLAFEDDLRNVEMFKNEGIPCVYVHSGYY